MRISHPRQYQKHRYSEGSASWVLEGCGETRLSDLIERIAEEDVKSHRIAIIILLYATTGVIAMRFEYTAIFLFSSILLAVVMAFAIRRSKTAGELKDSYFQTTIVDYERWAASTVLMEDIHPRNISELKNFIKFHKVPDGILAICDPSHGEGQGIDIEGSSWVMYYAERGVRRERVNFLTEEMAVESAVSFIKEALLIDYGRAID